MIARGYGYGGRWIGLWASLYYIGKLVGLIILKFTSTRGNRNNEQSGVNVNNATMLSKRVTFANDVGVNDINNCCTRLSWLKSQIYVFIHRLLPAGESSFRLVRRLVNLCDANTQQVFIICSSLLVLFSLYCYYVCLYCFCCCILVDFVLNFEQAPHFFFDYAPLLFPDCVWNYVSGDYGSLYHIHNQSHILVRSLIYGIFQLLVFKLSYF